MQQQRVSTKELAREEDEDEEENEDEEDSKVEARRGGPAVIKFHENEPAATPSAKKRGPEPKISLGKTNYKLPSPSLLTGAERGEKMDESS